MREVTCAEHAVVHTEETPGPSEQLLLQDAGTAREAWGAGHGLLASEDVYLAATAGISPVFVTEQCTLREIHRQEGSWLVVRSGFLSPLGRVCYKLLRLCWNPQDAQLWVCFHPTLFWTLSAIQSWSSDIL